MIHELVVKLAKESGWGYTRILVELRKLKVGPISRQSIKNILIENSFEPGPKRGKGTWSKFVEIHKDSLWQIDFFSKLIWPRRGSRQIFALAAIHIGTRWVAANVFPIFKDQSRNSGMRGRRNRGLFVSLHSSPSPFFGTVHSRSDSCQSTVSSLPVSGFGFAQFCTVRRDSLYCGIPLRKRDTFSHRGQIRLMSPHAREK